MHSDIARSFRLLAGAGACIVALSLAACPKAKEGESKVTAHNAVEATSKEQSKLRGEIVELADGIYSYRYYDVHEADSSYAYLEGRGFQGGGPSWFGIIHGLVKLKEPSIYGKLEFDPEGDGLAIRSADREALVKVAKLVTKAKTTRALLDEAIEKAVAEGQME